MAVDEQMEMAFMEEGQEVDPVSGNEVPTGSLPEEVRDDIPAQLSEGEYVVPADVVRYYGVKFFEDLRSEAKAGWSSMEQNGRVGGEPVGMEMVEPEDDLPFDVSELQVVDDQPEMNMGGYIQGYNEGGVATPQPPVTPVGSGVEVRPYEGPNGEVIYVQFMGGKPISYIPTGYKPKGTVSEEVAEEAIAPVQSSDSGDPSSGGIPKPETIDWTQAKPEDFNKYLEQRKSFATKAVKTLAPVLSGPVGGMFLAAERAQYKAMKRGLEEQLENKELDAETRTALINQQEAIKAYEDERREKSIVAKSGIYGGGTSMKDGLQDTDESGTVSFGDTWLGDLLGFDEDGAGVDNDSLVDSMSGSRRDFGDDDDGGSSSNDGGNTTRNEGSNSFAQNVANFFTPNDGKSYQGGQLVEDDKDEDK